MLAAYMKACEIRDGSPIIPPLLLVSSLHTVDGLLAAHLELCRCSNVNSPDAAAEVDFHSPARRVANPTFTPLLDDRMFGGYICPGARRRPQVE